MAEQQISMGMQYQAWLDMKQKLEEIEAKLDQQIIEDGAALTKLTGSIVAENEYDLRGIAANKPAANSVPVGATYWSVDTDPHGEAVEVSNGTNWTVV